MRDGSRAPSNKSKKVAVGTVTPGWRQWKNLRPIEFPKRSKTSLLLLLLVFFFQIKLHSLLLCQLWTYMLVDIWRLRGRVFSPRNSNPKYRAFITIDSSSFLWPPILLIYVRNAINDGVRDGGCHLVERSSLRAKWNKQTKFDRVTKAAAEVWRNYTAKGRIQTNRRRIEREKSWRCARGQKTSPKVSPTRIDW